MANGIAEIRKNEPFRVYVANFSRHPRLIPKNVPLGRVRSVQTDTSEQPSAYALLQGKETDLKEGAVWPRRIDDEGNKSHVPDGVVSDQSLHKFSNLIPCKEYEEDPRTWEEILEQNLEDFSEKSLKEGILRMLRKHQDMWKGQLGEVKATEHRIDLEPDTRPIRQAPYRAGQKTRELIKSEIDRMTAQGVIEPAMSEWASAVVIVPKTDGIPRVCVDYRK